MKRSLFILAVIGVCIVLGGSILAPGTVQSDPGSQKPTPHLTGIMDLFGPEEWEYGVNHLTVPAWDGTITFEEVAGTYGMRFFHLSPRKGYSQASPFEEWFEVYDLTTDEVYLAGPDEGVSTWANKKPEPFKYRMNGVIEEASPPFDMWLGRNIHMDGTIYPLTVTADGIFRAN